MLLAIDAGNTNIVMGVFEGGTLKGTWRVSTEAHRTAEEHWSILREFLQFVDIEPKAIDGVCLCCVVPPLTPTLVQLARQFLKVEPVVLTGELDMGIKVDYEPPRDVGSDRIANAVAAFQIYGGPCIVVDFGTATTFDAIAKDGTYLGGAIAPGITISAEALFQHAAQLRRIEIAAPPDAIGKNTVHSMQSGLVYGYVGLVKELVSRFKQELGKAKVIATGGLAELVAPLTGVVDEINPNLTLIGLRIVYERVGR